MSHADAEVRHVVAWLQPVRWITCIALWAVLAVVWLLPHLDLSLRGIGALGLAAAICRTLVVATSGRPGRPPQRRAGEPFFTTKDTGLGLGLFLVRTFAERSGGTLDFDVRDGTTAILEIPALSPDARVAT